MDTARAEQRGLHYGWIVLSASVLVAMGALGLGRFGYPVILPSMKDGLGLNYTETGLLATGNFIGYLTFSLIGGLVATRFSPRVVISVFLFIEGASLLLTGFASEFYFALAMRVITGIGSGGSNVPIMGLASSWFSVRKRGMATGTITGGIGLGLVISGGYLPVLMAAYAPIGWRYAWYFLGVLTILIGVLALIVLRNRPEERGLDPIGGGSVVPAAAAPVEDRAIYRQGAFWHLAGIYVLFGFSYVIYSTFFPAYISREAGMGDSFAGALWALVGAISVVSGFVWGIVSDRWGRAAGFACVFGLQTVGYACFAATTNVVGLYASAILFGLTAWSIPAIMAAACGDAFGPRRASAALGMVTMFFSMGQALAPAVGGYLGDVTGTLVYGFALAAVTAAVGVVGSLLLKPARFGRLATTG